MRRRSRAFLIGATVALAFAGCMSAGAQSATNTATEILHVDPVEGYDGGPGSLFDPLRTLQEALDRAVENRDRDVSTRVMLHPGTYRESVDAYYNDSSGPLIRIEAAQEGTAVVSGSDVWDDWSCDGSLCTHEWPYAWGYEDDPWVEAEVEPLGQRREMIFVEGERLEQRLSPDEVTETPGSFYVDEDADEVLMHRPEGLGQDALVEVAVRPRLFRAQRLHDLVIDGIVFEHAAAPIANAAVYIVEQDRVTIEDVVVRNSNWDGLGLALGEDLVVRRSTLNENGASGVNAFRAEDLLFEDNETNRNNWRGRAGGLVGWSVGNKFIEIHGLTIRRHTSTNNLSRGMWLDYDVHNALLEEIRSCRNLSDGIFIELSPGPITVRNSTFCENGAVGIQTSALEDLSLEGNAIYDNEQGQIFLTGDLQAQVDDAFTGVMHVLHNEDWIWVGNTITAFGDQPLITTSLPEDEWMRLMSTASLDFTTYDAPTDAGFELPDGSIVSFEEWQEVAGQDANSTFASEEGDDE